MKIVTWNCGGGLRNKLNEIDELRADILVVQECEDPVRSKPSYAKWADNYIWAGDNKNKGIGIFARGDVQIQPLEWCGHFRIDGFEASSPALQWSSETLKQFLPFSINNAVDCLAVWTKGASRQAFGYMGQFWKYLQIHKCQLAEGHQIILGDFNSNPQWDMPDRWWNHSDVVRELETIGIQSLYHERTSEVPGEETKPTFYHRRDIERPYHIDYVFVSQHFLESELKVGHREKWLSISDHMPIQVQFRMP